MAKEQLWASISRRTIESPSPLDLLRRHSISTVTLEDEHQQQDHNNQADDENDADKTSKEF
jgi:hypothetical protein